MCKTMAQFSFPAFFRIQLLPLNTPIRLLRPLCFSPDFYEVNGDG